MNKKVREVIAKELILVAKDLVGGSALSRLSELNDIVKGPYDKELFLQRDAEYMKIRRDLVKELVDEHVNYLKKNPSKNPAMNFAGSLSYNIEEAISKKYLGKSYPGIFRLISDIAPRGKSISPKTMLKNAYNKLYGRGVFEELMKNNKRK